MKVAIPSEGNAGLNATVCPGFYGCVYFTIVDIGGSKGVEVMLAPGGGATAFVLAGKGVQAVLVREIAEVERLTLTGIGMRVFTGASGTVQDAISAFMGSKLTERSDSNPCCH
ncbi:MAG: Dinitrogenase iron-molybdenum cofactor [Methanocella sp. PtaU1.Bin125]|nr:MAG: Dinitrogenase iron-molybdenum cofactor [Methanocella sp. PtaU1.Bin125]